MTMDATAHMVKILLSWTVHLSPAYSLPENPPQLYYQHQDFFIEHACNGVEKRCDAVGWYDNNGAIHLDERLKGNEDPYTRSLLVHEIVHYLQDISGKFDNESCEDYVYREREAYAIQRKYLRQVAQQFVALYQNYPPCEWH